MRPEVNEIECQAAAWAAKSDGELSASEQIELDAWLAADVRHLGAYLRARAAVIHLERHRMAALQAARGAGGFMTRRRIVLAGSIAASIAAAAIVVGIGWQRGETAVYATEIGQTKSFRLPDGSVATLNTQSRLAVNYTRGMRSISLETGEALFDVKPDRARPFVVAARGWEVRAVGTDFVVRTLPAEPLQVLVQKGIVALEAAGFRAPVSVIAGSRAIVAGASDVKVDKLSPQELARELAWREGLIFFRHRTLESAAREFARYQRTRIIIDDPTVANLMVTGSFHSNDPVGFAKAVALSRNLNATVDKNEVRLTRMP